MRPRKLLQLSFTEAVLNAMASPCLILDDSLDLTPTIRPSEAFAC